MCCPHQAAAQQGCRHNSSMAPALSLETAPACWKGGKPENPSTGLSPLFSDTFRSTVHTPSMQAGLHVFPSNAMCSSGLLDCRTVHAWPQCAVAHSHPAPIHMATGCASTSTSPPLEPAKPGPVPEGNLLKGRARFGEEEGRTLTALKTCPGAGGNVGSQD